MPGKEFAMGSPNSRRSLCERDRQLDPDHASTNLTGTQQVGSAERRRFPTAITLIVDREAA